MERNLLEEIELIINSEKSDEEIREALSDYHENDIASVVHDLSKEEREKLYKFLSDEELADIFAYLDDVEDYIEELPVEKVADIIEEMDVDDAIDVLSELDEEDKNEILEEMDEEAVEEIEFINQYDEDMIGSKMTNNFVTIEKDMTIKQAMKAVVNEAAEHDNISTIFVLDGEKYYGSIELRDLIIARSEENLIDLVKTAYPALMATTKIDECINDLKEYALDIIPILNENNELIGVITSDDIIETVDEELAEDYVKFAGVTGEEEADESVFKSVGKRIPWLLALLALGLVASLLLSFFHSVIAALPALVFFQSLIFDMSGNSGTQSLAVTIRIISQEEKVDRRLVGRAVGKEALIGLSNGILLGTLSFISVFLFLMITKTTIVDKPDVVYSIENCLRAASCVGLALLTAMTISTISGAIIPIIFKKLKIDPAVASGPFITTLNDIIAIIIYYGLASMLFEMFL